MPLGVIWLVGMTNAFNLLDNMDGLAATLAAIAAGYFALDAVDRPPERHGARARRSRSRSRASASSASTCACAGRRPSSWATRAARCSASPSRASGSLTSYKVAGSTVATLLLPILILAVPILDTTLVTVVRLLEGRPIHQGGRDHTSHRLVYHGLSEKRSVVLLALDRGRARRDEPRVLACSTTRW